MTESLFNALRIVAKMIGADGQVHDKEITWFLQLIGKYGVNADQRAVLREDFNNMDDVQLIFSKVCEPRDRQRLLYWLNLAIQADGVLHAKEKKLFEVIKELSDRDSQTVQGTQLDYAKAILEAHNEAGIWKELKEAAVLFRTPVPFWRTGFMVDILLMRGIASRNRFVIWFVIILFLLGLMRPILARIL